MIQCRIFETKLQCGGAAAQLGAELIRTAIKERGEAAIIVATGASQFEMLDALLRLPNIAWNKVTAFHLDEYVNLPITHPASFRKYLWERFVSKLALPMKAFHYLDGEGDTHRTLAEMNATIRRFSIDLAFIGVGENGHLAFNDPPANFETEDPYLVVKLDEACRMQQVGEGWFKGLADVPTHAISMSVRHIMKSRAIICTAPDARKAKAVHDTVHGPMTPNVPASILQKHERTTMFLDRPAASLLPKA